MLKIKCPLCGFEFDPVSQEACKSCMLGKNCEKICCPNCQYEFIPDNLDMIKFFRNVRSEKNEWK